MFLNNYDSLLAHEIYISNKKNKSFLRKRKKYRRLNKGKIKARDYVREGDKDQVLKALDDSEFLELFRSGEL